VNAYKRNIKIQVQKIKKNTSSGHVSTARKFLVDRYTHLTVCFRATLCQNREGLVRNPMFCPFPVGLWHGRYEHDDPIGRFDKAIATVPLSQSDRDRLVVAIYCPICQNPSRSLHAPVAI
ncbi:hypothetical protein Taro_021335, partial [Colocasia esculenta]|nr:hypothetical protein [Colocasia esculenta]